MFHVFFKRFLAACAVAALLSAPASFAAEAGTTDRTPGISIPHLVTADFLRKVGGASVPVLVQFDAEWCPYCRKLQSALDSLREKKGAALEIYKVDADYEPDLMRSYEVRTLPTMIVFYQGRIVGRSDGGISEPELFEWISAVEEDIEKQAKKDRRG